ncbi:hypothetical protein [Sphingobacterium chungjuense]|uniref:hypothetical protein n=1 Tax=Sphingobacterium chungjuense TaxID=2675553 RepID=UPI00140866CA|nr:hypothetical protein [Sphingobacterium chungjuense]
MHDIAFKIFKESFDVFVIRERDNIFSNIAERNLCGRLAIYITEKLSKYGFTNYYADTEYNRKQGGEIKTIIDEDMEVIKIQSDLIVHTRGQIVQYDNLIAIEMKKSNRPDAEKVADRKRLRAMTKCREDDIWSYDGNTHPEHVCGYAVGIYIILNIPSETCTLEIYNRGQFIDSHQLSYRTR